MYKVIKDVLNSGDYDLKTILNKINSFWLQNKLTDTEYNELCGIARGGAKLENSVDVLAKLNELENRVRTLENNEIKPEQTIEEYQDGKWYYKGDKCLFEGATYVCIAPEGVVCVWSPTAYPSYWGKVE